MYTPGFRFIHAFFACLRLGVVAVPAYPPVSSRKQQNVERLDKIIQNCTYSACMNTKVSDQLRRLKVDSPFCSNSVDCSSGQSILSLPYPLLKDSQQRI